MSRANDEREILIEFVVQGSIVKATAIDAATGTEASIIGPASAARQALEAAAVRKLNFLLSKKKS